MNMMKMVQYDTHATELIVAKNRLTFAPRVLKRYIALKRAAQKKYPQIGQIDHKKYLHTVKIPN